MTNTDDAKGKSSGQWLVVGGQYQKVGNSAAKGLPVQFGKIGNELLKYRSADASAIWRFH
jgi:hypothetical protein